MFLANLFKFPCKSTKSVNCGSAEKMSLIHILKGWFNIQCLQNFYKMTVFLTTNGETGRLHRSTKISWNFFWRVCCWPSLLIFFSILSTFARDFCSKGSCWSQLATSAQHWGFSFDDPLRGCQLLQGPWGIILQHLPLTGFQQNENHSHTDPFLYFVASCIQVHQCHMTVSHLCYPNNHIAVEWLFDVEALVFLWVYQGWGQWLKTLASVIALSANSPTLAGRCFLDSPLGEEV